MVVFAERFPVVQCFQVLDVDSRHHIDACVQQLQTSSYRLRFLLPGTLVWANSSTIPYGDGAR